MFNATHFWVLKKVSIVSNISFWSKIKFKLYKNNIYLSICMKIIPTGVVHAKLTVWVRFVARSRLAYSTHAAIIIPASLEGLLSSTSRLIILSDLMSRLHPRKKMPKMTVSDSTQRTAICTKRMMNCSRSSWTGEPSPSLVINDKLQHPRTLSKGCFAVEIVRFSSPCQTFMSSFLWRFVTRIEVFKLPKSPEFAKVTCEFPWISLFKRKK